MNVSAATRARRREATRTGHQLPANMANALLWDVILQLNRLVKIKVPAETYGLEIIRLSKPVPWYPVVRFKGRYYLVEHGNPWPSFRRFCRLLCRPGDDRGDLCITDDGLVAKWEAGAARRGQRRPTIYGVQDDIEPVLSLPVAGAFAAAGTIRDSLPGAGQGADHEQLPGGIHGGRPPGGHQPKLHSETGA